MKIQILSIPVLDQEVALKFYTEVLGFVKKVDLPLGEGSRWLTLVSPDDQDGPELLLEPAPLHFEPARVYQKALLDAGIPCTQLYVGDVKQEYERMLALGVEFSVPPTDVGTARIVVFKDTCGNNLQLVELL